MNTLWVMAEKLGWGWLGHCRWRRREGGLVCIDILITCYLTSIPPHISEQFPWHISAASVVMEVLFIVAAFVTSVCSLDVRNTGFPGSTFYMTPAEDATNYIGSFSVRNIIQCVSECLRHPEHYHLLYKHVESTCVCKHYLDWRMFDGGSGVLVRHVDIRAGIIIMIIMHFVRDERFIVCV